LVSKNPRIRFNAMFFLEKGNINPNRIRDLAHAMTGDKEQQIRDRAYRILDKL